MRYLALILLSVACVLTVSDIADAQCANGICQAPGYGFQQWQPNYQAYYPAPAMCGGEFTPGQLAAWQSWQRNQPCYIGVPRYHSAMPPQRDGWIETPYSAVPFGPAGRYP